MSSGIWSLQFLKALAERVIATFLATLLALVTIDGFDFAHANWSAIFAAAGVAAGISLVKGVLANVATKDGPGLTSAEVVRGDGAPGGP